ncbi:hypothetical protein BGZ52_007131 [Haplosporangium bisporale]|nr:hypothetical protein BGZ52_007131 [Haplosporangium bisporale]
MEKCLCTSSALAAYTPCYPCLANGIPDVVSPALFAVACSNSVASYLPYELYFPDITTNPARPPSTGTTNGGSGSSGGSGGGNGGGGNGGGGNGGDSGSSNNTALYAGIGAGAGVLVLGVALFFYFRNKKSKSRNSTKTSKADAPSSLPPMQSVQQTQYLQPQPQLQQHLYAHQPVISPPPHQVFDPVLQQQQQQQYMHQHMQPMQSSSSGYYTTLAPVATYPQQLHQQGQQAMMFHQSTTSDEATHNLTPMPTQSSSYSTALPTVTVPSDNVVQTPVVYSPIPAYES